MSDSLTVRRFKMAYMADYQYKGKCKPIKLKLIGVITDHEPYNR